MSLVDTLSRPVFVWTAHAEPTFSPCPATPCYLVPTHFAAQTNKYHDIFMRVWEAIRELQAKYPDCIDVGYFPKVTQWRLKYLHLSDLREIHINCYWDYAVRDHFIEMNRVKGDGLFPATSEFYEVLRKAILADKYVEPKRASGRRPFRPGPPPLIREGKVVATGVTEEMFVNGTKPIFKMAKDHFFEPRLEAAKAMCDLSKRHPFLLNLPTIRSNVVDCLNSLIQDPFDDVRQFAVVACSSFAANPSYQSLIRTMPAISNLVGLVSSSPLQPLLEYEIAQMRRKAALVLELVMDATIADCFRLHQMQSLEDFRRLVPASPYFDPQALENALSKYVSVV